MILSALNSIHAKVAIVIALLLTAFFLIILPSKISAAPNSYTLTLVSSTGNSVTLNAGPGAEPSVNPLTVLVLKNLPLGDPNREHPISAGNFTISGLPNGTHTAELSLLGTDFSNDVTFTLPAGTGVPPTGTTATCDPLPPNATSKDVFNKYVTCTYVGNEMDSTAFNSFQLWATLDSGAMALFGTSSLRDSTNTITAGQGALAGMGKMIAMTYSTPPASGVNYMASQIQKLNPVQDAYAQTGAGYEILSPVQEVWENFRNISYAGFTIVFVVVGFMIMFRAHISPQAVATIQDSLPRIVVALILVTFSYAIAGFMIDMTFVFMNIALNALPATDSGGSVSEHVFGKSIIGIMKGSWGSVFGVTADAIRNLIKDIIPDLNIFLDFITSNIGGLLGAMVVGIALLFVMFKLFLQLLIAYATILILTLTAPFFFLLQALPGNDSAKNWFKQMGANLGVFVAIAIMVGLAGYLGGLSSLGYDQPALSDADRSITRFPLVAGDIDPDVIGKLAAIGLLLMTPGAADLVKNTIGAKSAGGGALGAAAGGALAGASAGLFAGPRAVGGAAGRRASAEAPGRLWGATRAGYGKVRDVVKGPGSKSP